MGDFNEGIPWCGVGKMGLFGAVLALVLGFYWCYAVISRWREDFREFRETKEPGQRVSIVIIWAITLLLVLVLAIIVFTLVVVAIWELRAWSRVS
jgi:hypothetical protein